ncbi:MAG: hypothetical protein ACI80V_000308 [Rhodothermales bacterium]|jgi:hypothetical protein
MTMLRLGLLPRFAPDWLDFEASTSDSEDWDDDDDHLDQWDDDDDDDDDDAAAAADDVAADSEEDLNDDEEEDEPPLPSRFRTAIKDRGESIRRRPDRGVE